MQAVMLFLSEISFEALNLTGLARTNTYYVKQRNQTKTVFEKHFASSQPKK